jgi:hypothetical protein
MLYGAAEKRVFMYGKLFLRLILSVVFLVLFFCIAPVLQSCSEGPDPFSDFSSHPDDPLLGRHDAAQSLDSFVQDPSAFPGNPPPENIAGWIKQYESAQTPEEKQFAAVFLLQHQFAVGISVDSDQPWCGSMDALDSTNSRRPVFPAMTVSSFLTEAQRKQAAAERVIFNNLDSQANYYTSVSIEYAQRHPDDPRVPESLSRAVKNTRMNCNNARTGALSKKAFDLLHNRYPNTSWAKNTKYWFGDSPY